MQLKPWRSVRRSALASAALLLGFACGGRSELEPGEAAPPECAADEDCTADACSRAACELGVCRVVALGCDDGDACTEDTCDPARGCVYRSTTLDLDADGHSSPRPGFAPGEPGACGDDCDDAASAAFPGAEEVCDGRDNDCNGVVDDGANYRAATSAPVRISSADAERAGHGGFVAAGRGFALTLRERYPDDPVKWRTSLRGFRSDGDLRFDTRVSKPNVPVDYGPLVWSGEELVTVWEDDRESGSYEVYFARFSADGDKLGPDARVSDSQSFSLNPAVVFHRSEYVVVWDDRRDEGFGEGSRLYGQRLDREGALLGENVPLTADESGTEFPVLAVGTRRLGLAYTVFGEPVRLRLRTLDPELALDALSEPFGDGADAPSIAWMQDGFVVVWESTRPGRAGNELFGAVFDESARVLVPPTLLATGQSYLRSHALLSLGDRVLVAWADDTSGNYDLYFQVFDRNLAPEGERSALTRNAADSLSPSLAVAADGTIGVVYDDFEDGTRQIYFTTLACE